MKLVLGNDFETKQVECNLEEVRVVAILGSTGTGKTTLLEQVIPQLKNVVFIDSMGEHLNMFKNVNYLGHFNVKAGIGLLTEMIYERLANEYDRKPITFIIDNYSQTKSESLDKLKSTTIFNDAIKIVMMYDLGISIILTENATRHSMRFNQLESLVKGRVISLYRDEYKNLFGTYLGNEFKQLTNWSNKI